MQERDRDQTKDRDQNKDKGREGSRQGQESGGSTWSPKRDDATEGERGTYGSKDKSGSQEWSKSGSENPKPLSGGSDPSKWSEKNPSQGGMGGGMRPDKNREENK